LIVSDLKRSFLLHVDDGLYAMLAWLGLDFGARIKMLMQAFSVAKGCSKEVKGLVDRYAVPVDVIATKK